MVKQVVPPTIGRLGGTTHPILPQSSTQRLPWSPSCSLTTSTSILDPPWAMLTWHLQGWPASTCLRPNDLDMFRHAQGCPDSSNYIQTPQVHSRPPWITTDHCRSPQITADQLQITCSSTELLKHLNDGLENSRDSDANQVTQYRGLGLPSWLTPTPGYVAHVCYLTTPKAPPETPCRTTLIRIRRPEWMVYTRGWKNSKLIQSNLEKPKNHKETGLNWNKLDQQSRIDLPKIWTKYSSPIRRIGQSRQLDWTPESTPIPLIAT